MARWNKARLKRALGVAAGVAAIALGIAAQARFWDRPASSGQVRIAPAATAAALTAPAPMSAATVTTNVGGYIYDWTELQAAINSDTQVDNAFIIVGNATDPTWLYSYQKGNLGPDTPTELASASKWLTAALAIRMVQAGIVGLEDGMRPPLDFWTTNANDTKSQVRLKHVLSMTSGFNASPLAPGCQTMPSMTLYNCAKDIHNLRYDYLHPGNAPGAQFSYGPQGLQVAAAYLEAADTSIAPGTSPARERNFHELFKQHVLDPFGMTATTYHDPAEAAPTNPWVAGGAWSTARDYAKFLRGLLAGQLIGDMAEFTRPRTIGLDRLFVPGSAKNWEYALGSFVECALPADCATSKVNSSPGAYGWTGWIDRETGYYALIATDLGIGGDGKGIELEQAMQGKIKTAIANRVPAP